MSYPPNPSKKGISTGAKVGFSCLGCAGVSGLGLIGMMVIGVVASSDSDGGSATVEAAPSTDQAQAEVTEEEPESNAEESEDSPELDEPFELDAFTVTVDQVTTSGETIENNMFADPAEADGQWVIVEYTVTNDGDAPEFWWGDISIRTSDGNLYGEDSDASVHLASEHDIELFPELNPGSSATQYGAVDIPADAKPGEVEFADMLGVSTVSVELVG